MNKNTQISKPSFPPKRSMLMSFLAGGLLLVLLSSRAHAGEAESRDPVMYLKLEGVMLDTRHPAESVAVINGKMVQIKEEIDDFKLLKIEEDAVWLRDLPSGQEFWLQVWEKRTLKKTLEKAFTKESIPDEQTPGEAASDFLTGCWQGVKKVAEWVNPFSRK